ncbi:MAG: PGF-pre-PGF domain-containing protein, partial [Candidatus Pacearchaeota archaeon]|nr:PGF-pre-PGF domain-containing protein [Candidatus Pacearchaeota archaeon]
HVSQSKPATTSGSYRWYGNASQLIAPNRWTVADKNGIACGFFSGNISNSTGCYIYYYPLAGENPNTQIYEVTQDFFYMSVGSNYLIVKNIDFLYQRTQAVWCENCLNPLFEGNLVAHVSNWDDNAYGIWIDYGGGAIVRNNTFYDSRYWGYVPGGGADPNSRLISFMNYNPNNPPLVEYNNVSDAGGPAIGTKGGVSNAIIRYNTVSNSGYAIRPDGSRCDWTKINCVPGDSQYFAAGGWQIYGNIIINSSVGVEITSGGSTSDAANNTKIYNNVFSGNLIAINIPANNTGLKIAIGTNIQNNIIANNIIGIMMNGGGSGNTITVEGITPLFSSDYNLFFNNVDDYRLRQNWGGSDYSGIKYPISQMQSYNKETHSFNKDPLFTDIISYTLQTNSPAIGTANAALWGKTIADIGRWPNPRGPTTTSTTPNNTTTETGKGTGGGGGGSTGGETSIISKEKKNSGTINARKPIVFTDFAPETGITEIAIEVHNDTTDLSNIPVTVSQYETQPAEIPAAKQGKVYKYLQIDVEDSEDRISSANISFEVEKSWAEANNLDKNNIALFKFFPDESKWTQLSTVYISSDENSYYYTSQLAGFSYFVVGEAETPIKEAQTPGEVTESGSKNLKFGQGLIFLIIELILIVGIIVILIILIAKRKEYSTTKSQA